MSDFLCGCVDFNGIRGLRERDRCGAIPFDNRGAECFLIAGKEAGNLHHRP
jgi:hypothetical protein